MCGVAGLRWGVLGCCSWGIQLSIINLAVIHRQPCRPPGRHAAIEHSHPNQSSQETSNNSFHAHQTRLQNRHAGTSSAAEAATAIALLSADPVTGRMLHALQGQQILLGREGGESRHLAPWPVNGCNTSPLAQRAILLHKWPGLPLPESPRSPACIVSHSNSLPHPITAMPVTEAHMCRLLFLLPGPALGKQQRVAHSNWLSQQEGCCCCCAYDQASTPGAEELKWQVI